MSRASSRRPSSRTILITADTKSDEPVALAGRIARDRAIVVAVGAVGLSIPRKVYYEKELDLRLSRSYGPGRYDAEYEEKGRDYPYAYVRWTEQRNMEAFLNLVAVGTVNPSRLVTHRVPIAQAERAYIALNGQCASLELLTSSSSLAMSRPSGTATPIRSSAPAATSA